MEQGKRMKKKFRDDTGALVVEATIVYPVSFLVIFLMLFMGNIYWQKARIEGIVSQATIEGAALCADPTLAYIKEHGKVPELEEVDIEPYRYVFGMMGQSKSNGMKRIEESVADDITTKIGKLNTGFFSGMKPKITDGVYAVYKSYFIASSFYVELTYRVDFPMRLLFTDDDLHLTFSTHCEVPVGDTPEFIRNVNLVQDLLESTGVAEKVEEVTGNLIDKVKGFFKNED